MGMVDAAEATIVRVGQLYMEYCADAASGERPFTIEMDYRLDQMAIQAGFLAYDATDQLVRTAGSSPMANGARMQRYLRDLVQYRTHQAASPGRPWRRPPPSSTSARSWTEPIVHRERDEDMTETHGTTLRRNAMGVPEMVFLVIAFAAPLAASTTNIPMAIGLGNGIGAPGTWLVVGLLLVCSRWATPR